MMNRMSSSAGPPQLASFTCEKWLLIPIFCVQSLKQTVFSNVQPSLSRCCCLGFVRVFDDEFVKSFLEI